MANPQSVIHGNAPARDVLLMVSVFGLTMLHVFELPRMAALHGGIAFVAAWALGLLLLALPLLLLELMLGRRSRRSPLEGLAFLTREADARRGWRAAAWGGALAALLGLAVVALIAGGSINYLAQDIGLVHSGVVGISEAGLVWPLGTGSLFIVAAGLSLLPAPQRGFFILSAFGVALVLLGIAAFAGLYLAEAIYVTAPLTADTWRAAFRLALLSFGGGLGVAWLGGMRLAREAGLGRLALGTVAAQFFLAALLLLALAPFVAASVLKEQTGVQLMASGSSAWMLLVAVILLALLALLLVAEPLLLRLREKGLAPMPAVALVFVAGAALAEAVWFIGRAEGLHRLTSVLGALLLLVLLVLSVFGGWGMKISHARKELALPSEAIYNVWRVAVRLAVPLAILWALTGYIG
jgi:SNF family Na+-dependent transporter